MTVGRFPLGDLVLASGETLLDATIVYEVHGELNAERDNLVVMPTFFMGTHVENRWLIGADRSLDPARYCVVVPNLLGNGQSTSPTNATPGQRGSAFPSLSYGDQVRAQHRLVTEAFGVASINAVVGWSMGASQALHWAVAFPEFVQRVFASCGSAKTSEINTVFIDSVEAAIKADSRFLGDEYPANGMRAAARVYAGWGFSGPFYREERYRALGFETREQFVVGFWEGMLLAQDPHNLLAMLSTWRHGDVGVTAGTRTHEALAAIRARTAIVSAELDMYFTPADGEADARRIPEATFEVIPGVWGHSAGAGLNPVDILVVDHALGQLLSRT